MAGYILSCQLGLVLQQRVVPGLGCGRVQGVLHGAARLCVVWRPDAGAEHRDAKAKQFAEREREREREREEEGERREREKREREERERLANSDCLLAR